LPNGSSYPSERLRTQKQAIHQDPRPFAPRSPPGQNFEDPEYYPYQQYSYPYQQSSYPYQQSSYPQPQALQHPQAQAHPQSHQQPQWVGPSGHGYPSEQNGHEYSYRDDYNHTREYREMSGQYAYTDLNYPTKPSPQDGHYYDYGYVQSYDNQMADYGNKQHPGYQLHPSYGEMVHSHPPPMHNRRPHHEEVADNRFMDDFRYMSFGPQNGKHMMPPAQSSSDYLIDVTANQH
jgi:hypothetical protein